jgi:23S rRNA (adenine2503-C2)-methyltransferase
VSQKRDIRNTSEEQLQAFFQEAGEPQYRLKQLLEWIWEKRALSFEEMSNLPLQLQQLLSAHFEFRNVAVHQVQKSMDGTMKNAVQLFDGKVVESVLIPTPTRSTACVSSQVGCSLDCHFCATARLKRMRNLNPDEIYDQVVLIDQQSKEHFNRPLSNIVFMGMGEPLLNYAQVLEAIQRITSPEHGLGMAPKRITLSTVGIVKMIRKLADDGVRFNLAVSLHSAIDEKRSSIMPINRSNPLDELMEALQYWYRITKRKVTFEYVVWKGFNDQEEDIQALIRYGKRVPCKVNLIEYNAIGDERFQQADPEVVERYQQQLQANGITAKIRRSRGKDIDAACGQLANKELPKAL